MKISSARKISAGTAVLCVLCFQLLFTKPLWAVVTSYEGESVEWNFETIGHLAGGGSYTFNPTATPGGCSKQTNAEGWTEMNCSYTADAPFYGDIYRVTAAYTPAAGTNHRMSTTVKPYPNHDEYNFQSPISDYVTSSPSPLNHSFESIFIPMWPEDVNTAYEIVIRYYSDERDMAFNIHFWFWGFDPSAIPNIPWLKGEPGENPYLKFCGGKIRPEKKAGGPAL